MATKSKKQIKTDEIGKSDIKAAIKSLNSASFKRRFMHTDCNVADPDWKTPSGQPINEHVRSQMDKFKKEVESVGFQHFHGGVFQKFADKTTLIIADQHLSRPVPTARDLFHVYGANRDNIKDWKRYYWYAWTQKGPNAIIYSTDAQIIREGKLACNSYAYSGQNSYALVGAGIFFRPQFGDSQVTIKPFVQWLTSASFTGTESAPASATASLGIYVVSWPEGGGEHFVDRDYWIPVWSQNTQDYLTGLTAGTLTTAADGFTIEILAVTQRKYAIYVYVFLETIAGPQQQKNEVRFVTLDIDAVVPYIVLEEKLV